LILISLNDKRGGQLCACLSSVRGELRPFVTGWTAARRRRDAMVDGELPRFANDLDLVPTVITRGVKEPSDYRLQSHQDITRKYNIKRNDLRHFHVIFWRKLFYDWLTTYQYGIQVNAGRPWYFHLKVKNRKKILVISDFMHEVSLYCHENLQKML